VFLGFASTLFIYVTVYVALKNTDVVFTILMGAMAACVSAYFVSLARAPVSKLVKSVMLHQPINIREAFTRIPSEQDRGLPSDNFVGYDRDAIIRLIHIMSDLGVRRRTLQRFIRARVR